MQNQAQVAMQAELLELDALLTEEAQSKTEDFDDLDSLLNESVSLVKAAKEVKAAKLTLKRSSSIMDATERQFIEAKVAAWEAENTWKTIGLVAVFRYQTCSCGSFHRTFSHFMHHQQHRTDPFAKRWVSAAIGAAIEQEALPKSVIYMTATTEICSLCAFDKGFDLLVTNAQGWEAHANGELQHAE